MNWTIASRARTVVAFAVGAALILVGLLHSIEGWAAFRRTLVSRNLDDGMIDSVAVAWHLGGLCFVGFGILTMLAGTSRLRDGDGSVRVLQVIGGLLVAFGVIGFVWIRPNPVFALFIAPGLALCFAPPTRRTGIPTSTRSP